MKSHPSNIKATKAAQSNADSDAPPSVVISLDFELRWGMHDRLGTNYDGYRQNLENVREAVPALLKLLSERRIRATWACVGALGCTNWDEYFRRAPAPPQYRESRLQVNAAYADMDPEGSLHFAPDLLHLIRETPGQELGTHTFSHIYMREPGVTAMDVIADLSAVSDLWSELFGQPPISLVFPRNQVGFMDAVSEASPKVVRGTERPWFHGAAGSNGLSLLPRSLRLADSLNPLAHRAAELEEVHSLAMTRASLFLRVNLPQPAWALHLLRIKRELARLRQGEIFHLWWHPHNLGKDMAKRLGRVEEILNCVVERCADGQVQSRSMKDLVPLP